MRQRSIGTSLVRGVAGTLLLAMLSGCGLGVLLSKPWIRNANNNKVVFFGDSIFALVRRDPEHGCTATPAARSATTPRRAPS